MLVPLFTDLPTNSLSWTRCTPTCMLLILVCWQALGMYMNSQGCRGCLFQAMSGRTGGEAHQRGMDWASIQSEPSL